MVVNEITFSVYSRAVMHFENKERLDKACVLFDGGERRPKRDVYHTPPSSTEVREREQIYPYSPLALHGLSYLLERHVFHSSPH